MGPPRPRHSPNIHLQILDFSDLFLFVSVCVCARTCTQRPEEDARFPGASVTGGLHLTWMLELSSGPLQKQYLLSTVEPPLQPLPHSCCFKHGCLRGWRYLDLSVLSIASQTSPPSHMRNVCSIPIVANDTWFQQQVQVHSPGSSQGNGPVRKEVVNHTRMRTQVCIPSTHTESCTQQCWVLETGEAWLASQSKRISKLSAGMVIIESMSSHWVHWGRARAITAPGYGNSTLLDGTYENLMSWPPMLFVCAEDSPACGPRASFPRVTRHYYPSRECLPRSTSIAALCSSFKATVLLLKPCLRELSTMWFCRIYTM